VANLVVMKIGLYFEDADELMKEADGHPDLAQITEMLNLYETHAPVLVIAPVGTDEDDLRSFAFEGEILDIRIENRLEFDEDEDEVEDEVDYGN
jgi:hypothetical protein